MIRIHIKERWNLQYTTNGILKIIDAAGFKVDHSIIDEVNICENVNPLNMNEEGVEIKTYLEITFESNEEEFRYKLTT